MIQVHRQRHRKEAVGGLPSRCVICRHLVQVFVTTNAPRDKAWSFSESTSS